MIDSNIEIININDNSLEMLEKDSLYTSKIKFIDVYNEC